MSADEAAISFVLSVVIATHERASLLGTTLDAVARQNRQPDEVVVSDSSQSLETLDTVESFKRRNPQLAVHYVKSPCKVLPWHRWWGFQHSTGDIILFLDDDITLADHALQMLEQAYIDFAHRYDIEQLAGVGFYTYLDNGSEKLRRPNSFEERWLGIAGLPSASITSGGLGIPSKGMPKNTLVEVQRLSGGRMSFRRRVLDEIGLLDQLVDLFDRGLGPSEDTVLSHYARRHGKLYMLTYPLAVHPCEAKAIHTVDHSNGWQKGAMETWGRAHTMRWMATDISDYRIAWSRVASLEVLRAIWWGVLRRPIAKDSWARLAGALWGILRTLRDWDRIPPSAKSV